MIGLPGLIFFCFQGLLLIRILEYYSLYQTQKIMSLETETLNFEYLNHEALEMIVDLMDGEAELIIDLIETLRSSNPDLLEQLNLGVQTQDSIQIREAAHALKSSNAQMGAMNFSDLCRQMEERGKRQEMEDVDMLFELIKTEYQKVDIALDSWKAKILSV